MIHFIDDIRDPGFLVLGAITGYRYSNIPLWEQADLTLFHQFTVSRSSAEAKAFFLLNGIPDIVSFDHDLGEGDDAVDLVTWMIEEDYDRDWINSRTFKFIVHSMNPVGARNIYNKLTDYLNYKGRYND